MQGSPPFALSAVDYKSILWTLGTAAIAAALTVLADSVLPEFQAKGLIDASLFTVLTTVLHAARKYISNTQV